MSEREQERDEYEMKINELKHLLSRKSNEYVEHNDTAVQKVIRKFLTNQLHLHRVIFFVTTSIYIFSN